MKVKDKLLQIRIKDEDKELIREAAEQQGVSLSSFILEASINKAKRAVRKNNEMGIKK